MFEEKLQVPIPTPQITINNQSDNAKMAQAYRTQQQAHKLRVQQISKMTPHIPKECITTVESDDITNAVSLENGDQNLNMIATVHYKKGEIGIWNVSDAPKRTQKLATGSYRMDYGWHMLKFIDQDYLVCSYPYPGFKVINWKTGVLESNIDVIDPSPLSEAARYAMVGFGSDYVVIGCRDGSLSFYNRSTKENIKKVGNVHTNYIRSVQAITQDGLIASGGLDGLIRLVDVETGDAVKTLQGHTYWVSSIASLDNNRIVSASGDKTVRVWDVDSGECIHVMNGHTGRINQVIPIGGSFVATCSDDKYIMVWDTDSGKCVSVLKGHSDHVKSILLLADSRIVSSSLDGTLKIWK
jgi:WD40 repeat protein